MPTPYSTRHRKVREARGRAADQSCVDCQQPACDWSQVKGTDGEDPSHYEPRCKACHFKYDDIPGKVSKTTTGRTLSPEHRAKISAGVRKKGWPGTEKQLAALAQGPAARYGKKEK